MFDGESEYQGVIDKLNKIQSHGLRHKLSIPQMAIIGDQSSGKSSVLEALTQLSFPRDKEMCTRFATLVNVRRNPALTTDVLSAKINGEDAFNARYKDVKPSNFHEVIREAVSVICRECDISDKVLEITLSGPNQCPLTVIDLPGFISTTLDGQDQRLPEIICGINRRYIKEPRTIILAVVQANADLNTSRALCEAGAPEHDPEGERTVPIVTKPDRIENGLLKDWVDVINNNRKFMKQKYLVMRNAGYDDKAKSWEEARQEEDRFFDQDLWNQVPADRKGRVACRNFLGKLLFEHISRELPALKREVDAALDTFRKDLTAMDVPINSIDE
ncbi:P-loop containing nucleoside triphosphate hydrolase protein, partial [Mortierella sp. GBAus27b]